MKIYKSTRAKNAIEKRYARLKYVSCTKEENGTYSVLFTEECTPFYHCFICDFSASMVIILRHSIGEIKFTETECVSDNIQHING